MPENTSGTSPAPPRPEVTVPTPPTPVPSQPGTAVPTTPTPAQPGAADPTAKKSPEEPAEKPIDVSKQEQLLATAPSNLPKDNGSSTRIVAKGDSITQVLIDTYGYCDKNLLELFKEANPQIKNLNIIEVGEELQLPRLSSERNRAR